MFVDGVYGEVEAVCLFSCLLVGYDFSLGYRINMVDFLWFIELSCNSLTKAVAQ